MLRERRNYVTSPKMSVKISLKVSLKTKRYSFD